MSKFLESKFYYRFILYLWILNAIHGSYNISYLDVPNAQYIFIYISPFFIAYGALNLIWKSVNVKTS